MIFRNREHAARLLAEKLKRFRGSHPLILAIPRGAVPMGQKIAESLDGDLDVALVRKIGAPYNPEFAIGAVSESGEIYLSAAKKIYDIPDEYIEDAVAREMQTLRKRRAAYTPIHPPFNPLGRAVILVDDGVATGATMLSAVRSAKAQKAARVIVAAPVASQEAAGLLAKEADEMFFLSVPEEFWAIGQFYAEFPQVTDQEVQRILSLASKRAA